MRTSQDDGGGIWNNASLIMTRVILKENDTFGYGYGGGAYSTGAAAEMTILNSTVFSNTAYNGGGVNQSDAGSILIITQSTLIGNTARYNGGGIFVSQGRFTIISSTISGNTAFYQGGGILSDDYSTIIGSIIDSEFSGNTATTSNGGGIYQHSDVMTLTHVTISGNYTGGLETRINSFVTMTNSIIANNTGTDCISAGTFTDNGFNLVEDGTCISAGTSISGDPKLGPLADNGGDTLTHALLAGSPAINHIPLGVCTLTVDQRGFIRPFGSGCDIGAVEMEMYIIYLPLIIR